MEIDQPSDPELQLSDLSPSPLDTMAVTLHAIEMNARSTSPRWEVTKEGPHEHIAINRVLGKPFDGVRSSAHFAIPAPVVVRWFLDSEFRKVWDPNFESSDIIEQVDDTTVVWHLVFRPAVRLVKRRDVVIQMSTRCHEGYYVIEYHSVIHHRCPPVPGVIRAEIMEGSGAVITPLDNVALQSPSLTSQMCKVTQIEYLDYKGHMPAWIVGSVAAHMSSSLTRFRQKAELRFVQEITEGKIVMEQIRAGPFPTLSALNSPLLASPSPSGPA